MNVDEIARVAEVGRVSTGILETKAPPAAIAIDEDVGDGLSILCLANIASGQKSLTLASPAGTLQAMRAAIRTGVRSDRPG